MKRKHYICKILIKTIVTIIIIAALLFGFIEWRVSPVVRSVAAVQGKSYAISAINRAAQEVLEENRSGELETSSSSEDGRLCSIITNTAAANMLKNKITLKAQESISDLRHQQMNIPIGMIFGGELIGPSGPDIPVFITLSGTTDSDFEESFESAGINQTVHKLSLRINADIRILTPSGTITEKITTSVLIGETVIVGNVPLVNSNS